jgi:hypothetical protein
METNFDRESGSEARGERLSKDGVEQSNEHTKERSERREHSPDTTGKLKLGSARNTANAKVRRQRRLPLTVDETTRTI